MIFLFKISRPGLEPTQLPGQWVSRDVAMGIEWPGCEVDFTISSAKVKMSGAVVTVDVIVK